MNKDLDKLEELQTLLEHAEAQRGINYESAGNLYQKAGYLILNSCDEFRAKSSDIDFTETAKDILLIAVEQYKRGANAEKSLNEQARYLKKA